MTKHFPLSFLSSVILLLAAGVSNADKPAVQVHLQARFLEVNDDFLKDIGIDHRVAQFEFDESSAESQNPELGIPILALPTDGQLVQINQILGSNYSADELGPRTIDEEDIELIAEEDSSLLAAMGYFSPDVPVNNRSENADTTSDETGFVPTRPTTVQFEQRDSGLTLYVTPSVSTDAKLIRMSMRVEYNRQIARLPQMDTREFFSTVTVPDTGSILLGALTQPIEDESDERDVPVLGDIPVLGRLFKNGELQTTDTQLVILLRPRLIGAGSSSGSPSAARIRTTPSSGSTVQQDDGNSLFETDGGGD